MSKRPLAGKIALVTGSYRNLGSVTAETLAGYGASVIINDLDLPELTDCGRELQERICSHGVRAAGIPADLSVSDQVRRLAHAALDTFGRVDILINNAGPGGWDPYLSLKEAAWDRTVDVNLKAVYLLAQELAPQMKANGWGRIVSMSAGSAFVRNHSVYGLAKAAVTIITEALALELGPEITVNAIAPGQILESLPAVTAIDPTFGDRYITHAPAKRLVTRAEIAEVIALLCTPTFDMMTGMTIRLDGGAEIPRF